MCKGWHSLDLSFHLCFFCSPCLESLTNTLFLPIEILTKLQGPSSTPLSTLTIFQIPPLKISIFFLYVFLFLLNDAIDFIIFVFIYVEVWYMLYTISSLSIHALMDACFARWLLWIIILQWIWGCSYLFDILWVFFFFLCACVSLVNILYLFPLDTCLECMGLLDQMLVWI